MKHELCGIALILFGILLVVAPGASGGLVTDPAGPILWLAGVACGVGASSPCWQRGTEARARTQKAAENRLIFRGFFLSGALIRRRASRPSARAAPRAVRRST